MNRMIRPRRIAVVAVPAALSVLLSGCGSINASTGAFLNASSSSYDGAKQNVQARDDLAFRTWADMACAMPIGALQRNATGNQTAVQAVLLACPVAGMRVSQ